MFGALALGMARRGLTLCRRYERGGLVLPRGLRVQEGQGTLSFGLSF